MFKSKKEFALAMMEGRRFKHNSSEYFYDDSFENPFRFMGISADKSLSLYMIDSWELFDKVTEVKKWYEDIPEQGVLCWVWDFGCQKRMIDVVTGYIPEYEFKFSCSHNVWRNAQPLTEEEALNIIYKKESNG